LFLENQQPLLSEEHDKSKLSSNKKEKNTQKSSCLKSLIDQIRRLPLTRHDIVMIVVNILMFLSLILVRQYLKLPPRNVPIDTQGKLFENINNLVFFFSIIEILVIKTGNQFGGSGGLTPELEDDAEKAKFTFRDNITRVTALETFDENGLFSNIRMKNKYSFFELFSDQPLLLSLTFEYSNGKSGHKYGGINPAKTVQIPNPLSLNPGEHINGITIYEDDRKIVNPHRMNTTTYIIVGIRLKTNYDDIGRLFGSTNGTQKRESFDDYFLGYVEGKAGGYIDSLRFTWYRYCYKNSIMS
jgi:hypothetical protein